MEVGLARHLRWLVVSLIAVAVIYVGYLGLRVVDQRVQAPKRVAEILAKMDPAIDAIPQSRLDMLLRVEDPTFWTNSGIDFESPGAGMTTLSQGLGKRIFFGRFSPGFAKLELIVLTRFALTPKVAKRDILRAALASAYLGRDENGSVIGFPAGAKRWYGKDLGALTDQEFLGLVAMLPAPNLLDPARHRIENAERVRRIQRLLAGECRPTGMRDVELVGCAQ